MRFGLSDKLRYKVVDLLEGQPSPWISLPLRGSILILLTLVMAPWRVTRELVFWPDQRPHDLKAALRSALWIWNRSWIPFKFRFGTFFDIGWYLSEAGCQQLARRRFVSDHELKRQVDLAQLKLSTVKTHALSGDQQQLRQVDGELQTLVNDVLTRAWVLSATGPADKKEPAQSQAEVKPSRRPSSHQFDNDRTKSALLDFDDLSKSIGLNYFLVSGTFLGAVRDGSFIGHDHDIDLGVFEEDLAESLVPALSASEDFHVTQLDYICLRKTEGGPVRYEFMEKPAIIRLAHKTGISLDLFVHFHDGDLVWHGSSVHRWDNVRFALKDYDFLGRPFQGAADHDRYLTENYGADWRIPKVKFNVNFDTPNMSFAGTANALVFFCWVVANAAADHHPGTIRKYIELLSALDAVEIKEGRAQVK